MNVCLFVLVGTGQRYVRFERKQVNNRFNFVFLSKDSYVFCMKLRVF